jgi:WD40 repeat protein
MPAVIPIDAGAHVEWAGFRGGNPVFALVDGTIVSGGERPARIELVAGLTAIAADGADGLVAGGEDGAVRRLSASGEISVLREKTGKWVDAVAVGPAGAVAAASARHVAVFQHGKVIREIACERSVEGLAFAPKGMRLALARYNGVELVWINTDAPGQMLEWKGAHLGVIFSPDGRYVVTTMQENALHGWRLTDAKHMRMTGYPAKVNSLSWSAKGHWLASSGAPAAIVWPFFGKDGPMGKAPRELGAMGRVLVTQVACHPREEVVATGYEDGMIAAVRIADARIAVVRRGGNGAITALNWEPQGGRIAFGSATGEAGIVDMGA